MSANPTPVPTPIPNPPLPNLPCPNCGANLLTEGFYNSRTETQRLREDNYAYVVKDHLYIDHNEDNYQTVDHECDLEAYCSGCEKLLPWALYQIRELDGAALSQAPATIAKLLAEIQGDSQSAIA